MATRRTPARRLPDLRHTVTAALLTAQAAGKLAELAAAAADGRETGGILLGTDHGLAGPVIVRHCGDPGPDAIRRPAYFRRDLSHATAVAAEAAAADGSAWIGEWHTHKVGMPEPSTRDLRTYKMLLDDPQLAFARILAIIVLPDPEGSWQSPVLNAWSFTGSVLRQLPIQILSPGEPAKKDEGPL
jgi:integrative and conjugative element protein (TIGR02256 family)